MVKIGREYRDLIICNNCLWAVSMLKGCRAFVYCPICKGKDLEVIFVEDYESYKIGLSEKNGLSIEFAVEQK